MNVGIDIGTKFSSIAIINENGDPEALEVEDSEFGNNKALPTAVFLESDEKTLLGYAALKSAYKSPGDFKEEFKKHFGQDIPYKFNKIILYPQDLYKEIMVYFLNKAEKTTGKKIENLVISYPAAYSESKIKLLEETARISGFRNVRVIDEPTAAAYYYYIKGKIKKGEKLLVYDFRTSPKRV